MRKIHVEGITPCTPKAKKIVKKKLYKDMAYLDKESIANDRLTKFYPRRIKDLYKLHRQLADDLVCYTKTLASHYENFKYSALSSYQCPEFDDYGYFMCVIRTHVDLEIVTNRIRAWNKRNPGKNRYKRYHIHKP